MITKNLLRKINISFFTSATFFVVVFVVVGFVLRIAWLSHASLWIDESFSLWTAAHMPWQSLSALLKTRDPLYHALLQSILLLGGDVGTPISLFATRFLSVIAGVALIPIVFVMGKQWFGKSVGLMASIMMTFSTLDIAWSRQVRMYTLWDVAFWATFAFGMYLLEQKKKNIFLIFLWCASAIAGIAVHRFGVFLFPSMMIAWYALCFRERQSLSKRFKGDFGMLCIFIVVMMILVIGNKQSTVYADRYFFWLVWEHPMSMMLTGIALISLIRRNINERTTAYILLLFSIIMIIFSTLSLGVPLLHYRYLLVLNPALFLLASVGFWSIGNFFRGISRLIAVGIASVCVIIVGFFTHEWTFWPQKFFPLEQESLLGAPRFRSYTPQPNFKAMYGIIRTEIQQDDVIITPYPTVTWWYRGRIDDMAIPISLTSANTADNITEYYTGTATITAEQFAQIQHSGKHGWIILDDMARTRMAEELRATIIATGTVRAHDDREPFSSITLYRF